MIDHLTAIFGQQVEDASEGKATNINHLLQNSTDHVYRNVRSLRPASELW